MSSKKISASTTADDDPASTPRSPPESTSESDGIPPKVAERAGLAGILDRINEYIESEEFKRQYIANIQKRVR